MCAGCLVYLCCRNMSDVTGDVKKQPVYRHWAWDASLHLLPGVCVFAFKAVQYAKWKPTRCFLAYQSLSSAAPCISVLLFCNHNTAFLQTHYLWKLQGIRKKGWSLMRRFAFLLLKSNIWWWNGSVCLNHFGFDASHFPSCSSLWLFFSPQRLQCYSFIFNMYILIWMIYTVCTKGYSIAEHFMCRLREENNPEP